MLIFLVQYLKAFLLIFDTLYFLVTFIICQPLLMWLHPHTTAKLHLHPSNMSKYDAWSHCVSALWTSNRNLPMRHQWCLQPHQKSLSIRHIWVKYKIQAFKSRLSLIFWAKRGRAFQSFLVHGIFYVCSYFSSFPVYQLRKTHQSRIAAESLTVSILKCPNSPNNSKKYHQPILRLI